MSDYFSDSEGAAANADPTITGVPGVVPGISITPPEPLIQPMVRLLGQFTPPWGPTFMRSAGQRNNPNGPDEKDNWTSNGCRPTCIAMIVRWWAEDNPDTANNLQFAFAAQNAAINPLELCQRIFGNRYVPSIKNSNNIFVINHPALATAVRQIQ